MRSSHGKGEYAPHGALLCRRRAMGSNDLPPYALSPTLRKPAPEDLRLDRPHLRRCLRSPQRPGGLRSAHRMGPQLRGGRGRGKRLRRIGGLRLGLRVRVGRRRGRRLRGGRRRLPRPRRRGRRRGRGAAPGGTGRGRIGARVIGGDRRHSTRGVRARAAPGHGPVRVGVGAPDAPPGPPGAGNRVPGRIGGGALRAGGPRGPRPPASSSPTLIQPVDAAIVSAVTAAQRTGADNWRTSGTSGARGRRAGATGGSGERGAGAKRESGASGTASHRAQLPRPRRRHARNTTRTHDGPRNGPRAPQGSRSPPSR